MIFEEWKELEIEKDPKNPFTPVFQLKTGEKFYVEPNFYTQLQNFKYLKEAEYPLVLKRMEEMIVREKLVVFTMDFEMPLSNVEGASYLEIGDVLNSLGIYVEDKSRGSDYGD